MYRHIYMCTYIYLDAHIFLVPQSTSRTRVMSESLCVQNGSRVLWNGHKFCLCWRPCDAFGCNFL